MKPKFRCEHCGKYVPFWVATEALNDGNPIHCDKCVDLPKSTSKHKYLLRNEHAWYVHFGEYYIRMMLWDNCTYDDAVKKLIEEYKKDGFIDEEIEYIMGKKQVIK